MKQTSIMRHCLTSAVLSQCTTQAHSFKSMDGPVNDPEPVDTPEMNETSSHTVFTLLCSTVCIFLIITMLH
jgi:hypothetical protein